MNSTELNSVLSALGLTQIDAAKLLQVNVRTLRRWLDGDIEIPGPAVVSLRTWQRLQKLPGVEWRPDRTPLFEKELARRLQEYRSQSFELSSALKRVADRGGPKTPWEVDLGKGQAKLGLMTVYFYRTSDDGFSPNSYSRMDEGDIDDEQDAILLEDAYACIARIIDKSGWP